MLRSERGVARRRRADDAWLVGMAGMDGGADALRLRPRTFDRRGSGACLRAVGPVARVGDRGHERDGRASALAAARRRNSLGGPRPRAAASRIDFVAQARTLFRVAACGPSGDVPPGSTPRSSPITATSSAARSTGTGTRGWTWRMTTGIPRRASSCADSSRRLESAQQRGEGARTFGPILGETGRRRPPILQLPAFIRKDSSGREDSNLRPLDPQ